MKKIPLRLFGIFGFPLAHTLSPAMQEAAFSAAGLKGFYLVLELDLPHFKKAMQGLGKRFLLDGFNVTVPYKEAVIPYMDELTPEARAIGAVNTVFRKGSRWVGANTDAYGFAKALKEGTQFGRRRPNVLILGAGGGARAVVYALAKEKAPLIQIANRHKARALKIVRDFKPLFPGTVFRALPLEQAPLKAALELSDLAVNATSVGLAAGGRPVLASGLVPRKRKMVFFDLIYRPEKTLFLKTAQARGHKILGGASMLLYQGAKSFELWTGKKAPVPAMRKAFRNALKGK